MCHVYKEFNKFIFCDFILWSLKPQYFSPSPYVLAAHSCSKLPHKPSYNACSSRLQCWCVHPLWRPALAWSMCKPWLAKEARLVNLGCWLIKATPRGVASSNGRSWDSFGKAWACHVSKTCPCVAPLFGRPWCLCVQALACQGCKARRVTNAS